MLSRHPLEISLSDPRRLVIRWEDGHASEFPVDILRDFCPCATCRKARMDRNEQAEQPKKRSLNVLGAATRFEIDGLEHVGRYALGINWKDGHRSIFTWEYFSTICPCDECRMVRGGPPQPFDPLITV